MKNILRNNKGEIAVPANLVLALGSLLASSLVGYYSGQISSSKDLASTNIELTRYTTKTDQIEKNFDRLERKLDSLLEKNGINPSKLNITTDFQ